MAEVSSGCLVTREGPGGIEILLVHPRRATFRRPLFGIPKGIVEEGESLAQAAVRETLEETGLRVIVRAPLGSVRQKSGKTVHAFWATVAPQSEEAIDERGRCQSPDAENDVCRFYPAGKAIDIMIPAQREFVDRLEKLRHP